MTREQQEESEQAHIEDLVAFLKPDPLEESKRKWYVRERPKEQPQCEPFNHLDDCRCDEDYDRWADEQLNQGSVNAGF